jgi:hypothetical protein
MIPGQEELRKLFRRGRRPRAEYGRNPVGHAHRLVNDHYDLHRGMGSVLDLLPVDLHQERVQARRRVARPNLGFGSTGRADRYDRRRLGSRPPGAAQGVPYHHGAVRSSGHRAGIRYEHVQLVIIRFLLGIPLGSDIATGYTYIMESMPKGKREIMGTVGRACSVLARSPASSRSRSCT